MKMRICYSRFQFLFLLLLLFAYSCKGDQKKSANKSTDSKEASWEQPGWLHSAVFYHVNPQDFVTEVGTNSFLAHIERLAEMGVDVIWMSAETDIALAERVYEEAQKQEMEIILSLADLVPDELNFDLDGFSLRDTALLIELRRDKRNLVLIDEDEDGNLEKVNLRVDYHLDQALGDDSELHEKLNAIKGILKGEKSDSNKTMNLLMTASPFEEGTVLLADDDPASRQAMAVLWSTYFGVPVIQAGQELSLEAIQEGIKIRSSIDWSDMTMQGFYTRLISMKHRNEAMWNTDQSSTKILNSGDSNGTLAYYRENNGDAVMILLNLSAEETEIRVDASERDGFYEELFTGQEVEVLPEHMETLGPWNYRVYEMDN